MHWRCGDCKGSLKTHRLAPMLHDEVWHAVARDKELLCNACLRSRIRRVLGRELRFEDLTVCMFNVWKGYHHELTAPGKQRIDYELAVFDQQEAIRIQNENR